MGIKKKQIENDKITRKKIDGVILIRKNMDRYMSTMRTELACFVL